MAERRIFFLALVVILSSQSYVHAEEQINILTKIQSFLSKFGHLFESINLPSIIPHLLNHANNTDQYLTTPELVQKYGYPAEIHTVITSDGYILEMHRIPFSPKSPAGTKKPVAFLQHGLLSSSADWVLLGPGKALAYLLADAGYDVWMGNARGNTYSKKHVSLSPKSGKFWDFSWHEMGVYDLPAVLDYVLTNTSQDDLYYVGHSMGTSMFYVLTSFLPQYNSKIRLMTSLAPIAFMSFVTSPISRFFSWNPLTQPLAELLHIHQFLPSGRLMDTVASTICSDESIVQQICSTALFVIAGYDADQLNMSMLPVLLSHSPAGGSAKSLLHYSQEMASGHFRQYDHGLAGNLYFYGHISPPDYNISAISAPVRLMYSDNDWFGDPSDVQRLYKALPNAVDDFRVNLTSFNHFDFLWAKDVKELVYDNVIEFMKKY